MEKGATRVVADSHLWIEFLSGKKSRDTEELARLIRSGSVVLAGPIVYEILVGLRREGERQYLQGRLRALDLLPTTDQVWFKAVELGRLEGVATRRVPFSDVLIAAHVDCYGLELFTRDPHFDVFSTLRRHKS